MPEKTAQNRYAELMVIRGSIHELLNAVHAYGKSRPISLAITKLEEADMWVSREAEDAARAYQKSADHP